MTTARFSSRPAAVRVSPVDAWLARRMGARPTPADLAEFKTGLLRSTLDWALRASPFYREHLRGLDPSVIRSLGDLSVLPRTSADDLRRRGDDFLCLSRDEIARVVTLRSSGTTGAAKRIHFTPRDLEHTLDFFHHGMTTFAGPGDRVLILLPADKPDSVGDLLARALDRMEAEAVRHGLPEDPKDALDALLRSRATCVVGFPVHVLAMASGHVASPQAESHVHSVLLCSDHIPGSLARSVEEAWDCTVYAHWGTTETGLGGGVECQARSGYHLREADIHIEITDPDTGRLLPDGRVGEIVLTTLNRRGMPLVRYRTGDLASMIPGPCPCGSALRRLGPVCGRLGESVPLGGRASLTMHELNEALFAVHGLLDFSATLKGSNGDAYLDVRYWTRTPGPTMPAKVDRVLETLLSAKAAQGARLGLAVSLADGPPTPPGAKRALRDERGKGRCANS